jgi:hypothetical protein
MADSLRRWSIGAAEAAVKGTARVVEELPTDRSSLVAFFNKMPWRTRLKVLSLFVGLSCGVVCAVYETMMHHLLHFVWMHHGPELFKTWLPWAPHWLYIILACTILGASTGALLRGLGEPTANLPGVVQDFYENGTLDHKEAPAMVAISLTGIVGGGSLGPEAPLVSIGGGFASLVCTWLELTWAETIFITMAGTCARGSNPRPSHTPTPGRRPSQTIEDQHHRRHGATPLIQHSPPAPLLTQPPLSHTAHTADTALCSRCPHGS